MSPFRLAPLLLVFATAAGAADPKPLKGLIVVGGCCHDYEVQKLILSEGTAARAHIEWTVVHQGGTATTSKIPLYEKADWAKGYDVVVHNECFSDAKDKDWVEGILKPHRDGLPAVVIHCAMHTYREPTGEWFQFVGVTSRRHGAHYAFDVVNAAKDDPVMKGFGDTWKTPAGELYQIEAVGEKTVPLATARSRETKKDEVCVWKNEYGKGRVFGTTIGHYNAELADPKFLDLLTRGILWACDKPAETYLKPFDPAATKFRWEKLAAPPAAKDAPKPLPDKKP
jgi:type 1 glutamine amidotransferase